VTDLQSGEFAWRWRAIHWRLLSVAVTNHQVRARHFHFDLASKVRTGTTPAQAADSSEKYLRSAFEACRADAEEDQRLEEVLVAAIASRHRRWNIDGIFAISEFEEFIESVARIEPACVYRKQLWRRRDCVLSAANARHTRSGRTEYIVGLERNHRLEFAK
jgi:hypothetical protein